MSNYKYWTEEEDNIVKDCYNRIGRGAEKELKKIFPDKTEATLRCRITTMIKKGLLKKHKNDVYRNIRKIFKREKEFIIEHIGKLTIKQMSEATGISYSGIRKFIVKYKEEHKEEFEDEKYLKFKEKMRLMKYQPEDMNGLEDYEVEFVCNDLGITKEEFDDFRYKFGKGSYKKGRRKRK